MARKAARQLPPLAYNPPPRAVIGCIQIPTDFVLDSEGPKILEQLPGVEMRLQKLEFANEAICETTFHEAAKNIERAGRTLLPSERCDVVGLACTSMSFVLGADVVDAGLSAGCPSAKTTDMARGQVAALRAIGASRVALVTPYIQAVAEKNVAMLETFGFQVVRSATMGLEKDEQTSLVSESCIRSWAAHVKRNADGVDDTSVDAVVIGCSAFRACGHGFIDALEKEIGCPVVTSTQAYMWHMLRTAGVADRIPGYGVLFAHH
jgi:maleate isomerase